MVHPQKRGSIKKVLKSTIIRILELKEQANGTEKI